MAFKIEGEGKTARERLIEKVSSLVSGTSGGTLEERFMRNICFSTRLCWGEGVEQDLGPLQRRLLDISCDTQNGGATLIQPHNTNELSQLLRTYAEAIATLSLLGNYQPEGKHPRLEEFCQKSGISLPCGEGEAYQLVNTALNQFPFTDCLGRSRMAVPWRYRTSSEWQENIKQEEATRLFLLAGQQEGDLDKFWLDKWGLRIPLQAYWEGDTGRFNASVQTLSDPAKSINQDGVLGAQIQTIFSNRNLFPFFTRCCRYLGLETKYF